MIFGSGDDDDDAGGSTSFDFRFEDNVTLSQDSIEPLCFKHHVDCVRYTSRAIEAETGESAKILVFVAPKRLARRLQVGARCRTTGGLAQMLVFVRYVRHLSDTDDPLKASTIKNGKARCVSMTIEISSLP